MQSEHAEEETDWLSVGQAAAFLGVSSDTIRRWEGAGKLTAFRTPTGHRRFDRSKLAEIRSGGEA
ncbi:MerR family transcriptional regulator [Gordonia sihwensis]|uniref:MerR family DNA-binding transcriptional regulator n=1 Tax=Gordonia sihwensis TaxID=173559 RepID=UPI0009EEEB97